MRTASLHPVFLEFEVLSLGNRGLHKLAFVSVNGGGFPNPPFLLTSDDSNRNAPDTSNGVRYGLATNQYWDASKIGYLRVCASQSSRNFETGTDRRSGTVWTDPLISSLLAFPKTTFRAFRAVIIVGTLLVMIPVIYGQTGDNVDLRWHVLGSGGASSTSGGNVTLGGTRGQTAPGRSNGGDVSLSGGFWGLGDGGALAVTLADFYAEQAGGLVRVTWETASELDNRGFNLYRGGSASGPDTQLND